MNIGQQLARILAHKNTVLIAIVEALADCGDEASNICLRGVRTYDPYLEHISRLTGISSVS